MRVRVSKWANTLENHISSLRLSNRDKSRLQAIFAQQKKLSRSEKETRLLQALENSVKKYPHRTASYYDLYNAYMKLGKTGTAAEILKNLVKYNPNEINGYSLLLKAEYRSRKYQAALNNCRKILESSDKSKVTHETGVTALIYSILCDYHLKRISTAKSLMRILLDIASETEISNIIQADGLDQEWKNMTRVVGK